MVDLGTLGGSQASAHAINDSNQIAGSSVTAKGIVSNGSLFDLNALVPSNSGFTITDAVGINDSGQILCDAISSALQGASSFRGTAKRHSRTSSRESRCPDRSSPACHAWRQGAAARCTSRDFRPVYSSWWVEAG